MKLTLLCGAVLVMLPAARGQSSEPTLPDASWSEIAPATVKAGDDWGAFKDVYAGSGENWKGSPIVLTYPALASYAPKTKEDLLEQVEGLRDRFAVSPRFTTDNGPLIQRKLLEELDTLLNKVRQVHRGGQPLTYEEVMDLVDTRFQRTSGNWPGLTLPDGTFDLVTDSVFFRGRGTQVILRMDKRASGGLFAAKPHAYYATLPQAIEFRAVCACVQTIFSSFVLPKLKDTQRKLSEINDRWDRYLGNGYSQYPWEVLLNSYRDNYTWTSPPETQWVLAHPDVGFLVDARSSEGAQLEPALLLHGIGHLWYFDEHQWYAGASLSASITSNSEFGLGYGATLHFGHTSLAKSIPQLSLSFLWQDYAQGDEGLAVGLNLDLGAWIADSGEDLFRGRLGVRQPDARAR